MTPKNTYTLEKPLNSSTDQGLNGEEIIRVQDHLSPTEIDDIMSNSSVNLHAEHKIGKTASMQPCSKAPKCVRCALNLQRNLVET